MAAIARQVATTAQHTVAAKPTEDYTMAPNPAGATAPARSSGSNEHPSNNKQQRWPRTAPPASSEQIQSYFAQLSDIQQMLSQRATLAAKLGSSAAPAAAKLPPPSLSAAVQRLSALESAMRPRNPAAPSAAGAGKKSSSKRRKHNAAQKAGGNTAVAAGQEVDEFNTAAAVAGALFSSAANASLTRTAANQDAGQMQYGNLQEFSAPAWCTAEVSGRSSYKGVQYLIAESKWQAYVVDHEITEVVWLGKYDTDWEAAQAHDMDLIRRVGAAEAAPLVNFQSSLTRSGSGTGSSGAMSMVPLPPVLTLQGSRASSAEAAATVAVTEALAMEPSSFTFSGDVNALHPLLPLPSMQQPPPAAATATATTAAAAAAFKNSDFSSSFTAPVLAPPLPLSLTGLATSTSDNGLAQYSNLSSGFQPLPVQQPLSVPGVAATTSEPQNLSFSACELPGSTQVAAPLACTPGMATYRLGTVQVTTAGTAPMAPATTLLHWFDPAPLEQPDPTAAAAAAGSVAAVGSPGGFTPGQPSSMMALLAPSPSPPPPAAAAAAGQQGTGTTGTTWLQQQQPAAVTLAPGVVSGGAAALPAPLPGQLGSGMWAAPGLSQLLPAPGQQSSSTMVSSLPGTTQPLGSSSCSNAGVLPMSSWGAGEGRMAKFSTTDVLMAAGACSSSAVGLPVTPSANTAGNASLPCSPVAVAAAAAPAAAATASIGPAPAAAWAASHAAAAQAAVPVSKYKGVEYLPAQQKWQAYVMNPDVSEVVFLGTHETELEAAHAHDRELMQRMGPAAAATHLNFVPAESATAAAQKATGAPPTATGAQQQQQELGAKSSALAALAEGPAMAAAMAALAKGAGYDRESIMQIAQAAAAAAAAAVGAAGAAAAAATEAAKPDDKGRSKKAPGAGRGRRSSRGAAADGAADLKPVSKYKGVSWSASCSKWVAVIWDRVQRKARHLGVFDDEETAAVTYDKEVVSTQGAKNTGLNFRDRLPAYLQALGVAPQDAAEDAPAAAESGAASVKGKARSSSYRGISWHERSKRWEARAWGAGRQHFVGSFINELDAARAYDKAILKLGGSGPKSASRLNFPLADYDLSEIEGLEFPASGGVQNGKAVRARQAAKRPRSSDDDGSEDGDE